MSVFTPVPESVLADWLKDYAIGRLVELAGISAGVQNSNFFVTTTLGRYVLTLFEGIPRARVPGNAPTGHRWLPARAPCP